MTKPQLKYLILRTNETERNHIKNQICTIQFCCDSLNSILDFLEPINNLFFFGRTRAIMENKNSKYSQILILENFQGKQKNFIYFWIVFAFRLLRRTDIRC